MYVTDETLLFGGPEEGVELRMPQEVKESHLISECFLLTQFGASFSNKSEFGMYIYSNRSVLNTYIYYNDIDTFIYISPESLVSLLLVRMNVCVVICSYDKNFVKFKFGGVFYR